MTDYRLKNHQEILCVGFCMHGSPRILNFLGGFVLEAGSAASCLASWTLWFHRVNLFLCVASFVLSFLASSCRDGLSLIWYGKGGRRDCRQFSFDFQSWIAGLECSRWRRARRLPIVVVRRSTRLTRPADHRPVNLCEVRTMRPLSIRVEGTD